MTTTTLPSRTWYRDAAAVKRAAQRGPVFITDRGRPTLAVLSMADYERLAGVPGPSLLEVMHGLEGGGDEPFEPGHLSGEVQAARFD